MSIYNSSNMVDALYWARFFFMFSGLLCGAVGALLSSYLASFARSVKTLISLGILLTLPILVWRSEVLGIDTGTTPHKELVNKHLVLATTMGCLFGLGRSMMFVGAT